MQTITINQNDAGQRLDKFLCKLMPSMPKGLLYKLIRKKDIKRNGVRCKGMEILEEGDVLTLYVKEEFLPVHPAVYSFERASGNLQVMYEDDALLVVYKPKGMDVHSGSDSHAVTLLDEVQKYLWMKNVYHPEEEQSFAPALCNRIDRNTEGLVIAAKNAAMLRTMNAAIRERHVRKFYLAVTAAPLPDMYASCKAWLRKDRRTRTVEVADQPTGKEWLEIRTNYRVLANKGKQQLVCVELLTGRTHQIRAMLAHLHAPVLGDPKYGTASGKEENQCLCAYALQLEGMTGIQNVLVTAPLPSFVKRYFPELTEETIRKFLET